MLYSYMYYMPFLNLIQGYFVPSSITCVNSMEVSYIPIAKARGVTTHWIGGRSVELPCACKCVRAAGAAFCQQYNANDDYRQCGDRTAKHHTALRLFFLPFSDSLYRSI